MNQAPIDMPPDGAKLVRFHRLVQTARPPQRADRAAGGTLPTRAARFCDAAAMASGFGYYVFAPMSLNLLWDGDDIFWSHAGQPTWRLVDLEPFPGLPATFDAAAPDDMKGSAPPFLTRMPEPGHVQIWTGLIAQTAPEWSLLIRSVANLPLPGGLVSYEGIVETDRWFGPLFTNIRLTRTHVPVRLSADLPMLQVQPLPRRLYTDEVMDNADFTDGFADFGATEWEAYRRSITLPQRDAERPLGTYAVRARRRRRCPVGGADAA